MQNSGFPLLDIVLERNNNSKLKQATVVSWVVRYTKHSAPLTAFTMPTVIITMTKDIISQTLKKSLPSLCISRIPEPTPVASSDRLRYVMTLIYRRWRFWTKWAVSARQWTTFSSNLVSSPVLSANWDIADKSDERLGVTVIHFLALLASVRQC